MPLIRISHPCSELSQLERPLYGCRVRAGFPSPADDFIDQSLDLNEFLIKKPSATFFAWAEGDSLRDIGISQGDLLIIDRSIERSHGAVVVAAIDGELTCKILDIRRMQLLSANPAYPPINVAGKQDLLIEGVVTYSIKKHLKQR
jgi:DNA polymerase V